MVGPIAEKHMLERKKRAEKPYKEAEFAKAALLRAAGWTWTKIEAEIGVLHETTWKWSRTPEFRVLVAAELEKLQEAWRAEPLANIAIQVSRLADKYEALEKVIEERAADSADFFPGASTGLLVKDYKGKDAEQLVVSVDTGTLKEMRDTLQQILKITGQEVTKSQLAVDLNQLTDEQLVRLLASEGSKPTS